jgi:hypothetical protein
LDIEWKLSNEGRPSLTFTVKESLGKQNSSAVFCSESSRFLLSNTKVPTRFPIIPAKKRRGILSQQDFDFLIE